MGESFLDESRRWRPLLVLGRQLYAFQGRAYVRSWYQLAKATGDGSRVIVYPSFRRAGAALIPLRFGLCSLRETSQMSVTGVCASTALGRNWGSSPKRVGDFGAGFHISGSMHVSTLRRRYSSSRRP